MNKLRTPFLHVSISLSRTRFPSGPSIGMRKEDLPLEFWSVNKVYKVLYAPKEDRLRIEITRSSLPFFIDDLHTVTSLHQRDWRMRAWAWYNHFAIWSLMAMAISGVYLWLASRPRHRIAQYSFAGGAAVFILLYALTR